MLHQDLRVSPTHKVVLLFWQPLLYDQLDSYEFHYYRASLLSAFPGTGSPPGTALAAANPAGGAVEQQQQQGTTWVELRARGGTRSRKRSPRSESRQGCQRCFEGSALIFIRRNGIRGIQMLQTY